MAATFTFLKENGGVAFQRSDAEEAEWTVEEMSLFCTYPFRKDMVIERGMHVLFQDPATGEWQCYEIRSCSLYPGESYQQFTAESLAISELTDWHIPEDVEMTGATAAEAIEGVLFDTGWSVGNDYSPGNRSLGDIQRGSVWDAIGVIRDNWNVNVVPRVTVSGNQITGRFLDIYGTEGEWRGIRLSVDKNCSDPCVTYDDSELYTALYGYGKSYTDEDDEDGDGDEEETLYTNFAEITWNREDGHPAKPYGQKYLEDPSKTALYGRNGRPRFGYYQNTAVDDPDILIHLTWETLSKCSDPKISITGTITDLKRMGYADQPLRLYDMAIVDLQPAGIQFKKQIIQLTVDFVDPTKNTVTIGDYIPNIIYINRDTDDAATGGGSSANGSTSSEKEEGNFKTYIAQNERNIEMWARETAEDGEILRQAGMEIDPITGVLIYHEDYENNIGSMFRVQSNKITAEVADRKNADNTMSSRITQESNRITAEVVNRQNGEVALYSRITQTADSIRTEVANVSAGLSSRITQTANQVSVVVRDDGHGGYEPNTAEIVARINEDHGSEIKIQADTINLTGYCTISELNATDAKITNLTSGNTTASTLRTYLLDVSTGFNYLNHAISFKTVTIGGTTYHLMGYT